MYAVRADLLKLTSLTRLLQLTDDEGAGVVELTPGVFELPAVAAERVDNAIQESTRLVDSFLSARYTVPLDTIPTIITDATANLAFCLLYDRAHDIDLPDGIASRRKRYTKLLEGYQRGEKQLPGYEEQTKRTFLSSKQVSAIRFSDTFLGRY